MQQDAELGSQDKPVDDGDLSVTSGEVANVPSDNTTMTDVVDHYDEAGWDGQFVVDQQDGSVTCVSCGAVAAPGSIERHSVRRLEGASDPADMAGVVALSCPSCGRRGTVVLAYGPHASPGEATLWIHSQDHRADDQAPGSMAPGEDDEQAETVG